MLVGTERVRVLSWDQGLVEEPDSSTYDLSLGDWRRYEAYAAANPARAQQTATHEASFDRRLEEWRRRFLATTAQETGRRVAALGWKRIVIAGEGELAAAFAAALPGRVGSAVVAETDLNLVDRRASEVAEQLEPHLEALKRREGRRLAQVAVQRAQAGDLAVLGADETLSALGEDRVEHLIIDPARLSPGSLGPQARAVLQDAPAELLIERAVERALLAGARVTSLLGDDSSPLAPSGGLAALLRY